MNGQHALILEGRVLGTFPDKKSAEKAKSQLPEGDRSRAQVAPLLVE